MQHQYHHDHAPSERPGDCPACNAAVLTSLDLFSCIGFHALGFKRAGIETVALCESRPERRIQLGHMFEGVTIFDDVRTLGVQVPSARICIGGPPCQRTSVASAIHGYRTGESLWPFMLHAGLCAGADWFVVEQPPGNAAWENEVTLSLSQAGRHVARIEFGASDIGAPYLRRRVYLVACTSLPRLEVARSAIPSAIESVKGAANARGDWDPDQLAALPVDARSAGEFDQGLASASRQERIEAFGDSNPPHMAEVIGRAIVAACNLT